MATKITAPNWFAVRNFRNKLWFSAYQDCPLVLGVISAYPKLTDLANQNLLQKLSNRAQLQDIFAYCKLIGLLAISKYEVGQTATWADAQAATSIMRSISSTSLYNNLILVDNKIVVGGAHLGSLAVLCLSTVCQNDFPLPFLNAGFDRQSLEAEIAERTAELERMFRTPTDLLDFYIDAIDRKCY